MLARHDLDLALAVVAERPHQELRRAGVHHLHRLAGESHLGLACPGEVDAEDPQIGTAPARHHLVAGDRGLGRLLQGGLQAEHRNAGVGLHRLGAGLLGELLELAHRADAEQVETLAVLVLQRRHAGQLLQPAGIGVLGHRDRVLLHHRAGDRGEGDLQRAGALLVGSGVAQQRATRSVTVPEDLQVHAQVLERERERPPGPRLQRERVLYPIQLRRDGLHEVLHQKAPTAAARRFGHLRRSRSGAASCCAA
jgi:hypothetical protein